MDTNQIIEQARAMHERVIGFRRHIHRHAELSFQERETADFITRTLAAEGLDCTPIAGTGVLVRITGEGDPKKAVVLRADIDALPVQEMTGLDFTSENDGVMHACGHDMHTAALMGALIVLNRHRNELTGTLFGLFQPGEELLPGGASMVLIEDPFREYNIRAFFGQHVDAELPTGVFGLRAGEYMASTDEIYITMHGEGGHAAMPALLKNPIPAAAALVLELAAISAGGTTPNVLTIGRIIADGATNIIPDQVVMEGTMRTFDEGWRGQTKERIRAMAAWTAAAYDVRAEVDIRDGYPSVKNDAHITDAARELLTEAFGEDAVIALDRRMTGEDFGLYTRRYPSLFYRFGVGGGAEAGGATAMPEKPPLGGAATRHAGGATAVKQHTDSAVAGSADSAATQLRVGAEARGSEKQELGIIYAATGMEQQRGNATTQLRVGAGGHAANATGGQQRFRLTGKAGKLHSAAFDPDEESLKYAVAGLVTLALNFK